MTTDKPDQDELDEAMGLSADRQSPLGVLKRHKRWADWRIEGLLTQVSDDYDALVELRQRVVNQALTISKRQHDADEDLKLEISRLENNLIDARQRDLNKSAEITKLREMLTDTRALLRKRTSERDDLAAVIREKKESPAVRTVDELKRQMAKMSPAELRDSGKSFGDAHLGVIDECLTSLKRIPASERAAAVQYLLSRAHTASWSSMIPPPQMSAPGERPYEGF